MPIPPKPSTYRCSQCGWKKTLMPRNDALLPGQGFFSVCPACRSTPLEVTRASWFEEALAGWEQAQARWKRHL